MSPRLASNVLVSALIRRVGAEGGTGAILSKGDPIAGAVLLIIRIRGRIHAMRERGISPDGQPGWIDAGPKDPSDGEALSAYLERRRRFDPDLWIVELEPDDVRAIDGMLA